MLKTIKIKFIITISNFELYQNSDWSHERGMLELIKLRLFVYFLTDFYYNYCFIYTSLPKSIEVSFVKL